MNICRILKNGDIKSNIIHINKMYLNIEEVEIISIIASDTPMYEISWKKSPISISVDKLLFLLLTFKDRSIIITMLGNIISISVYGLVMMKSFKNSTYYR